MYFKIDIAAKGLMAVSLLSLAGCQSISDWQFQQKIKRHQAGYDYCGKKYLSPYIGTPFDDLDIRAHLPDKYSYRIADARESDDQIFTADLRFTRIDIYVDKAGHISQLDCS